MHCVNANRIKARFFLSVSHVKRTAFQLDATSRYYHNLPSECVFIIYLFTRNDCVNIILYTQREQYRLKVMMVVVVVVVVLMKAENWHIHIHVLTHVRTGTQLSDSFDGCRMDVYFKKREGGHGGSEEGSVKRVRREWLNKKRGKKVTKNAN